MQTDCLQMVDKYWDEKDTPYSEFFISGLILYINIPINCRKVNPFKVRISCGSQNNTD